MGIIYHGVCYDCKERIELDKFYHFAIAPEDPSDLIHIDLLPFATQFFAYRACRLFAFMKAHSSHRIAVITENDYEVIKDYKLVMPWPNLIENTHTHMTILEQLKNVEGKRDSFTAIGQEVAKVKSSKEHEVDCLEYSLRRQEYDNAVRLLNRSLNGKAYILPDKKIIIPVSDNSYRIYDVIGD